MLPWADALVPFIAAASVIFIPGLLISSAAGATGWHRWALAAPLTFTVAGVSAIAYELVGIPFTTASFGAAAAALSVVTWLVARLLRRRFSADVAASSQTARQRPARTMLFATAAGLIIPVVMISYRLLRGIGSPTAIAQLFDNVFHLNAVALIAASGKGSSLTLGNLTEASRGFYPAGFHDVVAVVMGLGVTDVSIALNVVSITMASLVWPISFMFLATRIFGSRAQVITAAGLSAWLFAAFPYRLFSFGVLYPFMAGLTMLPVLIALVIEFFGRKAPRRAARPATTACIVAAAPGIALTHPSVVVAALVLATPFVVSAMARALRPGPGEDRDRLSLILGGAYVVGTIISFAVIRPPLSTAPWDPTQSPREAAGAIVLMSPGTSLIGWVLIPLAAVGLVVAIRRPGRHGAILASAAIGSILYFASAAMWHPLVRDLLVGVWYRDTERVSALFAIACLPLIVLGTLTLIDVTSRLVLRAVPRATARTGLVAAVIIVGMVIVVIGQRGALAQAGSWLSQSFGQAGAQPLLTDDERALLDEVPDFVPQDEVVVGDAATGASLTPAFSDREALTPHIFGARSDEEELLIERWRRAGVDPQVCEVIDDLKAYWALDFGTDGVLLGNERPDPYGLQRLDDAPGIAEVARVGDAVLYEAVACR